MATSPGQGYAFRQYADRLAAALDAYGGRIGGLLLFVFFIVTLGNAAAKLLWYDELVTFGSAALPTWKDVYGFYYTGLDTTSATPALIVHPFLGLPMSPEISTRLPFIFAFLGMLVCVYVFVRRRYAAGYALATCIALVLPHIVTDKGIEARSYAFTLLGTAFAMMCWQGTARPCRTRPAAIFGLWMGLAFAINVHSFAIFLFVPFAAAQAVRDYPQRRPDWPVWVALCLFPLGLTPVLHGQRIARHFYGNTFWSRPQRYALFDSYREVLFGADIIFVAIVFLFLIAVLFRRERGQNAPPGEPVREGSGFGLPEWTLVAVLGLMPFYALPASYLIHVYRTSYVLPFAIGFLIATMALVAEAASRARAAGTILFALLLVTTAPELVGPFLRGVRTIAHPGRVHSILQAEYNARPWVKLLRSTGVPLVGGDFFNYTQLWFYGPEDIKDRLTFVTDVPELAKYPAAVTTQTNFLLFGNLLGYRTMDVRDYERQHSHFVVAIAPEDAIWLPDFLFAQERQGKLTFDLLGPTFDRTKGHVSVFDVHDSLAPIQSASQP